MVLFSRLYLIAFDNRFWMIEFSLRASTHMLNGVSGCIYSICCCLICASIFQRSICLPMCAIASWHSTRSIPFSMLSISYLIALSVISASVLVFLSASAIDSLSLSVSVELSLSSSNGALMRVMGVRRSCAVLMKNFTFSSDTCMALDALVILITSTKASIRMASSMAMPQYEK